MISKKSDYHYCDLSGWSSDVGSDIYPLRPDDQKRLLKFCDKAFVTESYLSRAYAGWGITLNGGKVFMARPTPPSEGWAGSPLSKVLSSSGGFNDSPNTKWGTSKPTIAKDQLFDSESALYAAYFGDWQNIDTWYRSEASASFPLYESFMKSAYSRIATFKSYKYSYAVVAPLTKYGNSSYTSEGTVYQDRWYQNDNTFEPFSNPDLSKTASGYRLDVSDNTETYEDYSYKQGAALEYESHQTSPLFSLDIQKPALGSVDIELYLLCKTSGTYSEKDSTYDEFSNNTSAVDKYFLTPISSGSVGSFFQSLVSSCKSLYPYREVSWSFSYDSGRKITYKRTWCDFSVVPTSLVAVLTSNIDIDY